MNALILSAALDTNGQNARYAKAAEKHGTDKAVISAFAIGKTDPAGVVGRFQAAAEKLGGLSIRSASAAKYEYLQFPMDIYWDRTRKNDAEILEFVQAADVLHLNNSHKAMERFRQIRKPTLIHHHGSLFRTNPKFMLDLARHRKWVSAVSTVDLQKPDSKTLHWLPTAYDIDELVRLGEANRREPDGRIRIVSAPTNRAYKSTELLEAVVAELQAEGLPIDLELVEGRPWAECLVRKAQADIVFDQLMFGYGCNAVEAWGMGIPVIAGAEDPWVLNQMRQTWGRLPFYKADARTLKRAIRDLVQSADLRAEWADIGMAHVRKYHDELPALTKLAELYALAIKTFTTGRLIPSKMPSVTFISKTGKAVSLPNGERVEFQAGEAKVTDPDLINRLRYFATKRPSFGIREKVA